MRPEDVASLPSADHYALVQLVGEMAAAHEALHGTIDMLLDVTRTIVATQSELLANLDHLHGVHTLPHQDEMTPQLEVVPSADERVGSRRQAQQFRAHSAALVQRAHLLADQARKLQTDATELLRVSDDSQQRTNGHRPGPGELPRQCSDVSTGRRDHAAPA